MKKSLIVVLTLSSIVHATQNNIIQTEGLHSPSAGTINGNINYLTTNTNISKAFNTNNYSYQIINNNKDDKLDPLKKAQLNLLIADHPTKIKLSSVKFMNWVGLDGLFLSISLKNITTIPATALEIGIPDPAKIKKTRKIQFLDTKGRQYFTRFKNIAIEGNDEQLYPIISVTEIKKHIPTSNKFCLYDAHIDGPYHNYLIQTDTSIQGRSSSASIPISFLYTYKSIFNQTYLINSEIMLDFADRTSDFVVINGEKKKLECLD